MFGGSEGPRGPNSAQAARALRFFLCFLWYSRSSSHLRISGTYRARRGRSAARMRPRRACTATAHGRAARTAEPRTAERARAAERARVTKKAARARPWRARAVERAATAIARRGAHATRRARAVGRAAEARRARGRDAGRGARAAGARGPGESERRSGSPGCVGSADRLLGLALHGVLKLRARRYARRRRELVRSWQRFGLGRCGFGGGGRPARTGCASRRPSLLGRRDVPDARVSHGVAVLLEQRRPTRHGACALTACLRFLECCWRGPGLGSASGTLPLSISIT